MNVTCRSSHHTANGLDGGRVCGLDCFDAGFGRGDEGALCCLARCQCLIVNDDVFDVPWLMLLHRKQQR